MTRRVSTASLITFTPCRFCAPRLTLLFLLFFLSPTTGYEADLVNFLKQNGETSMAIIGTRVKKPSGVPKLKQFIVTRPGVFKRSGDKIGLA